PEAEFIAGFRRRLDTFQGELLRIARERMHARAVTLDTWEQFLATFAGEQSTFAWCHWDGTPESEAKIKEATKATIRCVPLPGQGPDPEPGACIVSGRPSKQRVLIAKAY
ncbi:MAG: proline--tRNA ligase, partial [Myxococcales bacterium]|nr:proline--tRNA ligase [Myxococcales bacterium]